MATQKIEYPSQTTYFICYEATNTTVTAYGIVEPTQVMETSQPILDSFLDESEWLTILLAHGIDPFPPPPTDE